MTAEALEIPLERATSAVGIRPLRWILVLSLAVLVGLSIAAGVVAYGTWSYANAYEGRLLPGVSVAGIDLAGMTPREGRRAVTAEIEPLLNREVSVTLGKRAWEVTPAELGARSNADAAMQTAIAASSGLDWSDWARLRWQDTDVDVAQDVALRQPRAEVEAFVSQIATRTDVEARDATLDSSSGWVEVVPERDGQRMRQQQAVSGLLERLRGGGSNLALPVAALTPEVTADDYDSVVLLRQSERKVYLYTDGEISNEWTVAVGTSGYPTPYGQFEVELKRYLPTWINPDPSGWGAGMPAEIGPGPGNPLGVRALNWSGGGAIRFHGTSDIGSLGSAASHGCVRMANGDVIELYDLVDEGTPIISI